MALTTPPVSVHAGTGKTHLLNLVVAYLKHDGGTVTVTASTGIAACHVGGVTLHSWAGCGVPVYIRAFAYLAWCTWRPRSADHLRLPT